MGQKEELIKILEQKIKAGISPEMRNMMEIEINSLDDLGNDHHIIKPIGAFKREGFSYLKNIYNDILMKKFKGIYDHNDFNILLGSNPSAPDYSMNLRTLDDLLDIDKQREKDGFPKKIKIQRVSGGTGAVVVPTTTEEKFYHDDRFGLGGMGQGQGGSGEGEEGDVLGEAPAEPGEGDGEGEGEGEAGEGEGDHALERQLYDLGKTLTKQFELPNIQEKRKKKAIDKYTYDLTDKNRGHGQVLDKKATLKRILNTNISLGTIDPSLENIDFSKILIDPRDMVYRILSREQDYQSEAIVFLARDYSGSMYGNPTEIVCKQHFFIDAWLRFQYEKMVNERYIVHDTAAKEVPNFETYYRLAIAGGTEVSSAFKLINDIVEAENLAKDYNIYIFYGGDGDDWDREGKGTIEEINKALGYANRIGMTIVERVPGSSAVTKYMQGSGLLDSYPDLLRMDTVPDKDLSDDEIIESIKKLVE